MKKFALLLIIMFSLISCKEEPLQLYDLRCENMENPLAIDSTTPHFSWKINSVKDATSQTHYEILVASSMQLLKNDQADIWASGKVASDESVMVKYAGSELQPRSLVFWKVSTGIANRQSSKYSAILCCTNGERLAYFSVHSDNCCRSANLAIPVIAFVGLLT